MLQDCAIFSPPFMQPGNDICIIFDWTISVFIHSGFWGLQLHHRNAAQFQNLHVCALNISPDNVTFPLYFSHGFPTQAQQLFSYAADYKCLYSHATAAGQITEKRQGRVRRQPVPHRPTGINR